MSDKSGQKDPSMEEILSSIRRIIKEDNAQVGKPAAAEDEDVLELTEEVRGDEPDVPRREPRFGLRGRDKGEPAGHEPLSEPVLGEAEEPAGEETFGEPAVDPEDYVPEEAGFSAGYAAPYAEEPGDFNEPAAGGEEDKVMGAGGLEARTRGIDTSAEKIVSETATAATTAVLGQLKRATSEKTGHMRAGGEGDVTIAEMVREMMRPMLREWMDQNLPAIVERIVRKEIQKLVERAQDDE